MKGEVDSAYKYVMIERQARDTLQSKERVKQLQQITFSENERQREIAAAIKKQAEDRKRNLLNAAIAMFIPFFFGVILLLRKTRVKPSTVTFLSILGVMLLFEFISLLLHPVVGDLTHHNPVFMILIMVAIGSLLVPLHHRSEKWIKEKMAGKKAADPVQAVNIPEAISTDTPADEENP